MLAQISSREPRQPVFQNRQQQCPPKSAQHPLAIKRAINHPRSATNRTYQRRVRRLVNHARINSPLHLRVNSSAKTPRPRALIMRLLYLAARRASLPHMVINSRVAPGWAVSLIEPRFTSALPCLRYTRRPNSCP